MLNEKDRRILRELRNDCRKSFAMIGRDIGMPISTVFDRVKYLEEAVIIKHSALLDYNRLCHYINVHYILGSDEDDDIVENRAVNSAYLAREGLIIDCVFRDMKSMYAFEELLEERKTTFQRIFIIEEMKKEAFSP